MDSLIEANVRAEAARYCDRHDITNHEAFERVAASIRHRGFLEAIEPINAQKRQYLNLLMISRPPVFVMSQNGCLTQMPYELPPEAKKAISGLDELIILEAQRWGFDTSQVRTGAEP